MRLACRISNEAEGVSEAKSRWREQVLPALVSNDWRLADHLWDDIFKSKKEVIHSLIDYVYIESLAFDSVSDILDGDVPTSELTLHIACGNSGLVAKCCSLLSMVSSITPLH